MAAPLGQPVPEHEAVVTEPEEILDQRRLDRTVERRVRRRSDGRCAGTSHERGSYTRTPRGTL